MNFLASPLGIAVLALVLYSGTSAALLSRQTFTFASPNAHKEEIKKAVLVWDASSPEVDQMISSLRREKEAMEQRRKEMDEIAVKLDQRMLELTQATQMVQRLQAELEKFVVRVRQEEVQNLKKLAKAYGAMSPEGAAVIFRNMDNEQIVKVMVFMKESETGPILEAFSKIGPAESRRAGLVSEKVRIAVQDRAVVQARP